MFNLHQESSDKGIALLRLEGELTVEHVSALRESLLGIFSESEVTEIILDCAETSQVDVFALQLLCSAHRTAVGQGKLLRLQGPVSDALANASAGTGFARDFGCSHCPKDQVCLVGQLPAAS